MEEKQDEVLTVKEAGTLIKAPRRTMEYLISTNQIPYSRLGKRMVRFKKSRLMKWMDEREGIKFKMPRSKSNEKGGDK